MTLKFHDSPFHVTHDEETAKKMCEEADNQTAKDMACIAHMIESANKQGILCEVIYSALQSKKDSIPLKCTYALMGWDCL